MFTASPATIPSPRARRFTATSPVTTPARAARPGSPDSAPSSATAATRSSAARTARSASPSVATGVPQTAITASPMNFSTTPPYRPITVRATLKYSDSNSRTASGSRASDNGVNPTTSQNSTEHIRRSAADCGTAGEKVAAAGAASNRVAPHRRQKRLPGVSGSPQVGQPVLTGAPQSPQKRSPSSNGAPHRPHPTRLSHAQHVNLVKLTRNRHCRFAGHRCEVPRDRLHSAGCTQHAPFGIKVQERAEVAPPTVIRQDGACLR